MSARVLIVDDMPANVKLLEARLSNEYFDVITATNGPSALQMIQNESPDIVLLDVMMPGMSGFEVCKKIKSDPKSAHIPVVMVTALSETKDRIQGLESGADDFLTKPVSDKALLARVRNLTRIKMMTDAWLSRIATNEQLGLPSDIRDSSREDVDKAKVLLIEDNPSSAEHLCEALASAKGDSVTVVNNGPEALASALGNAYELVILSLDLMEEDALRLVAQMRAREELRNLAILVLVEEHEEDLLAKAFEVGVNDYLVRPIERSELILRSRTQIRHRRYQERLTSTYRDNLAMAVTDSLTGLYNRRYLDAHLPRMMGQAVEDAKALTVAIVDVDHFKNVNDTYGHAAGDEVLKEVAARIRANVRSFDLVARLGGEEFVIVMPDCSLQFVRSMAERVRTSISKRPFRLPDDVEEIRVTISLGVAQICNPSETPEDLLGRADRAMYQAKALGRDKVWVLDDKGDGKAGDTGATWNG